MKSNIFASHAELYWAAGLPAIPLVFEAKRPAIPRWQTYSDTFPTKEDQAGWLNVFASGNIGLPMGPSSRLVAIDIDTDDPVVLQVLDRILPPSPWRRVGRKGRIQIYRWSGERTARIKAEDGSMICEILSKGTQFVLPPSIHPDTKQPYTANCDLWGVAKSAPPLPMDFEKLLKGALKEAGVATSTGSGRTLDWVPAGARDSTMVWHAGLLARAVLRGERSVLQVLGEMQAWVENFVEKVVGDPLTVEKAQGKVIEFLIKDVTSGIGKALPLGWDDGLTPEDIERLGLTFADENRSWGLQEMLDYVTTEFARHPDVRSPGRANAINITLNRLVRANPSLTPSEEGWVLENIAGASAGTRRLAALRKDLALLRRGDIRGEAHAQLADACITFLKKYGDVRFDAGRFWQWGGAAWAVLPDTKVLKIIADNYGAYTAGKRQSDHSGILKVMKVVAEQPLRSSPVKGVNFANGFLTEGLELMPHAPEYGMTYTLPYQYLPERAGHMPMFDQFLNDCWASDPDYGDKLHALQEMIGVSLMASASRFQMAFLLFGQAGAGKSVLQAVMKGLMPEGSSSSIAPTDWSDKFLPAELYGKIINFAGELSETRPIPGDIFKKVISGEELTAQFKNQHPFAFDPVAAHWFNSNFLPKTKDSSEGFNRRWLILEFNNRISPDKRITDLDQQILDHEREAIVAWGIQGYRRLLETGRYTLPTSHLALVETMAADNNPVRYFLMADSKLKWGEEHQVPLAVLHNRYWDFIISTGGTTNVPVPKFTKLMKELSASFPFRVEVERSGTIYRGIGI